MRKLICILLTLVIVLSCATAFAAPESSSGSSYTVTVKAETEGTGTVTGGGTYSAGKNAALNASPAEGYIFAGWFKEGDMTTPVSTTPEFTYSLEQDRTFIARFDKKYTVALSSDPEGGGTVSQSGSGEYMQNDSVTVTAQPADNYTFIGWFDAGSPSADPISAEASYTFEMQTDMQLVARFSASYTLDLTVSPQEGGSVSGGGNFSGGSVVTVTATPADGYRFAGWYDIGSPGKIISTEESYNLNLDENRSLGALFERSYGYTILWILIWIGVGFAVFVIIMRIIRRVRIVRRTKRRNYSRRPRR
ncbi:MAG: InlB B-repeat-containing protein [Christensenella sp.]|uniref:InlB B-repeat-containing protein n=1 Tax=Christensenella sp. TaxID=1935934 RepID=UPI002B1F73D7|nr:InlB B-repeat-containing protein [Christensenella sp.]MEA5003039.1 InlB B-repeat-containing protein [Christensenella sp.]